MILGQSAARPPSKRGAPLTTFPVRRARKVIAVLVELDPAAKDLEMLAELRERIRVSGMRGCVEPDREGPVRCAVCGRLVCTDAAACSWLTR